MHVATEPEIQYDWDNATPAPEVQTHDYSVRWSGTLRVPATGKYVFTVDSRVGFPVLTAERRIGLCSTAKCSPKAI